MVSRFSVLDIVLVPEHPRPVGDRSVGRRGLVTGIRGYDIGSVRYEVASMDDANVDDVAGIYDEDTLLPTGERGAVELFELPAGFRVREIATVSVDCPDADFSGRRVEISAGHDDDKTGTAVLGVWCEELGEGAYLPASYLTRTGGRLPPGARGRRVESAEVSRDGELLGSSSYVMLDEIDQYL
jgi:hypothetical protein